MSYDKFKQFRLNEKLLQQTVLIRNAIKMLQYDIQFQQEQEQQQQQQQQQMIIQQQQQQQHHMQQQQQQHLMEFDNSINRTINNVAQNYSNTCYDNLEDFLTRSEFTNNSSMLNNHTSSVASSPPLPPLSPSLAPQAASNQSNNVNNCYYVNTTSNEHQIQMFSHQQAVTTNEAVGNGAEENVDVEEEEEEEDDDEEETEDDEEEEDESDEELDDEDEYDEDDEDEEVYTEVVSSVVKSSDKQQQHNQKQFENKENQIDSQFLHSTTKKFSTIIAKNETAHTQAPTSDSIIISITNEITEEVNTQHLNEIISNAKATNANTPTSTTIDQVPSQLTVNLILTNENETSNTNNDYQSLS